MSYLTMVNYQKEVERFLRPVLGEILLESLAADANVLGNSAPLTSRQTRKARGAAPTSATKAPRR
jgi:hypothetical protein